MILLKGSANLHLERAALDWTHDVKCWETACGKSASCFGCGLYEIPFSEHKAFRIRRRRARLWNMLRIWKRRA